MIEDVREEKFPNSEKSYKRVVLRVQKRKALVLEAAVKTFEKKCQERAKGILKMSTMFLNLVFESTDVVPMTIEDSLKKAGFKDYDGIINAYRGAVENQDIKKALKCWK